MSLAVVTALGLGFSGCSYTSLNDVSQIGKNKFTLTVNSEERNSLYKVASDYCKQSNTYAKPIRERVIRKGNASIYSYLALDFECLGENNKKYTKDTTYEVSKDITIDSTVKVEKKIIMESKWYKIYFKDNNDENKDIGFISSIQRNGKRKIKIRK